MKLTYETAIGEFEYEFYPTNEECAEYYFDMYVGIPKGIDEASKEAYRKGAIAALAQIYSDYDNLKDEVEQDDGFRDFMKDKHERAAMQSISE